MTSMTITADCEKYIKNIAKLGKKKKAKKLSGYNVYCMESRKTLDVPPKEILTKLGSMWNDLTDEQKDEWKTKASEVNTESEKDYVDENDKDIEKLNDMIKLTIKQFKKDKKKAAKTEDTGAETGNETGAETGNETGNDTGAEDNVEVKKTKKKTTKKNVKDM